MKRSGNKVTILDTTCCDGMHAVSHRFTPEQVALISEGLEKTGVNYMEVSHGYGLGGSSLNFGIGAASDREWLSAARSKLKNTKLACMFFPGIGTMEDLRAARDCGVEMVRIVTHCTEADIAAQHIRLSRELGMKPFGVLMMAHMSEPAKLLEQAKLLEGYGAEAVVLMDSAGALMPSEVKSRVSALTEDLRIPVGFHGHANLQMQIPNALAAIESGATYIDATLRGLGAGAGNAQTEVLAAVLMRNGYRTDLDLRAAEDTAEMLAGFDIFVQPCADKAAITMGYAGVYGTFAKRARDVALRYGVDERDILFACAERKVVGGQEDIMISIAVELAEKKAQEERRGCE